MRHVVWDWNGTLFDDGHLVLEGLNAVLAEQGLPPMDAATYQATYVRPVQLFYERLFGRSMAPEEWQALDDTFHAGYRAALERATLAADAHDALEAVEHVGGTQSLLSMYRHDELVPLVDRFEITQRFVRVDGLRGPGGGLKAPHLESHVQALVHLVDDDPDRIVVIGDALDDAAAATHIGVRCVLYDGGSHPREELEQAGPPVAASLTQALELAGVG